MLPVLAFCMLGLPLPKFSSKPKTERFPCETCPCGCCEATACWDKCCCHTDQEKLDWAEENGVEPPKFLRDRVAFTRSHAEKASKLVSKLGSCCSSNPKTSCGCKPASEKDKAEAVATAKHVSREKARSCCSAKRNCCAGPGASLEPGLVSKDAQPNATSLTEQTGSECKQVQRVVMLESALKCLGIQMALLLFKNALTGSDTAFVIANSGSTGIIEILNQTAVPIYLDLDGPVPRRA